MLPDTESDAQLGGYVRFSAPPRTCTYEPSIHVEIVLTRPTNTSTFYEALAQTLYTFHFSRSAKRAGSGYMQLEGLGTILSTTLRDRQTLN